MDEIQPTAEFDCFFYCFSRLEMSCWSVCVCHVLSNMLSVYIYYANAVFHRSIRSTASVSVTPTAAAAPPVPALMAPWKTQACVPTTGTTVAAKLATQRPTDRYEQHTHALHPYTHEGSPLTHQPVWASFTIMFFFDLIKSNSLSKANICHLFSVEVNLYYWNAKSIFIN